MVGSGRSAFNAVLDLAELAPQAPGTAITWAVRRSDPSTLFGRLDNDRLGARGSLGARVRRLVEQGSVRLVTGFQVSRLIPAGRRIVVAAEQATLPAVGALNPGLQTVGASSDKQPVCCD